MSQSSFLVDRGPQLLFGWASSIYICIIHIILYIIHYFFLSCTVQKHKIVIMIILMQFHSFKSRDSNCGRDIQSNSSEGMEKGQLGYIFSLSWMKLSCSLMIIHKAQELSFSNSPPLEPVMDSQKDQETCHMYHIIYNSTVKDFLIFNVPSPPPIFKNI